MKKSAQNADSFQHGEADRRAKIYFSFEKSAIEWRAKPFAKEKIHQITKNFSKTFVHIKKMYYLCGRLQTQQIIKSKLSKYDWSNL